MAFKFTLIVSFAFLCHCILINGSGNDGIDDEFKEMAKKHGIDVDNPKPGTILLTPPKLSDEDEGSHFMPTSYRCAGCRAVTYKLNKQFAAAERHRKKDERLSEGEILTTTEEVCNNNYKEYGLKNVQGTNYLSGEGLEADKMSGVMEAGGKWAKRLQNICKEIMGEYEEERVYNFYRMKDLPLNVFICENYCKSATVTPIHKSTRDDL